MFNFEISHNGKSYKMPVFAFLMHWLFGWEYALFWLDDTQCRRVKFMGDRMFGSYWAHGGVKELKSDGSMGDGTRVTWRPLTKRTWDFYEGKETEQRR